MCTFWYHQNFARVEGIYKSVLSTKIFLYILDFQNVNRNTFYFSLLYFLCVFYSLSKITLSFARTCEYSLKMNIKDYIVISIFSIHTLSFLQRFKYFLNIVYWGFSTSLDTHAYFLYAILFVRFQTQSSLHVPVIVV